DLSKKVTIVTPNESEAELLSGIPVAPGSSLTDWESKVARQLLASGPETVILTLRERGAYLATAKQERLIPSYRVAVVDGAAGGDAFNGALAVALAEGKEMAEAIAFANAAGALATTRAGAQPSLPSREEVEAFLRKAQNAL